MSGLHVQKAVAAGLAGGDGTLGIAGYVSAVPDRVPENVEAMTVHFGDRAEAEARSKLAQAVESRDADQTALWRSVVHAFMKAKLDRLRRTGAV